MKPIALLLSLPLFLVSCGGGAAANAKIAGKTFSKTTESPSRMVGTISWSITFRNNGKYDISYAKTNAIDGNGEPLPDERITLEDRDWKYLRTDSYSWIGDWNIRQTNRYYVFSLSQIPTHDGEAYFTIQTNGESGNILTKDPTPSEGGYEAGVPVFPQ